MKNYSILFVCTGNICRSPTADGVMRHIVSERGCTGRIAVDSAGTQDFHVGAPPDGRSQEHAKQRGYDLSDLRARQIQVEDFENFDLILAMDTGHMQILQEFCPPEHKSKLRYFTDFCSKSVDQDVPDPYYGGSNGFEQVLDLVEDGCDGLLKHVKSEILTAT